jgi:hypothetical protein
VQIANQFKDMIEDNTKVIIPESPDQLVRDSAHGNLQIVKDIINKFPNVSIFHSFFNLLNLVLNF